MKTASAGILSSVCMLVLALLVCGPAWGGLTLHLDASDPSTIEDSAGKKANEDGFVASDVAQWYDKSGQDNHAIQGTAAHRPTFVSEGWTNGNDALRFEELEHLEGFSVTSSTTGANPGMTVFIVVKPRGVAEPPYDAGDHDTWLGSSDNGHAYISTKSCGTTPGGVPPDSNSMKLSGRFAKEVRATIPGGRTSYQMITAKYDAATGEAEILSDGGNMRSWWQEEQGQEQHQIWEVPVPPAAKIGTGTIATFDQIALYHGGGVLGVDGKGDVAEIMFYDEVLSAEEENAVGYALTQKWGLPNNQRIVRATVTGREISRLKAAPDQEYLFKGFYASTSPRAVVTVEWLNRDTMSLGALGKHLFKGYYAPNLSLDTFRESNISLSSFEIVLPETQGRRVEFFAEVRAPKSKRDLDVRVTISHDGDEELVRCDEISLRQGTIRDYLDEFSMPKRPVDEIFPIFGWLWPGLNTLESPTMREMALYPNITSDRLIAEYALANFSLGTHDAAAFGTLFAAGIPPDDERLAEITKDPMFWGFEGGDEPGEDRFPGLAKINERIQRLAPGSIYWVNHLPTYMSPPDPEQQWLDRYENFIKAYIDIVKPRFFSYDHYCLVGGNWKGCFQSGDYFANLAIARKLAFESNIDFGVVVSVAAFLGVRGASEAELRWQAFTTLAYGAKALGWFTYLTQIEYSNNNWRDAVINRDGSRTRHYTMLKQLNGEILNWGPTLLGLTSTGAYHTKPLPLRTHPISKSNWVESLTGGEALIGEFVDKDQHPYLMVVNRDYNNPASFTLVLRKPVPGVSMLSRETDQWQAIEGYDQATGTFSLQLSAGNAELLRLNDADRR